MKRKCLIPLLCVGLALLICGGIFWYQHPTHWSFNDRFVIGSTFDEIAARYGLPYSARSAPNGGTQQASYMLRDDTPELVMGYDNSLWYDIRFEDGVAAEVMLRKGYFGG